MNKFSNSLSISARLILLYSLSAGLILLLIAGFQYWIVLGELDHETDNFLSNKIRILQATLSEVPYDEEDLEEEIASQGDYMKHYVRILDPAGRILIETEGMSGLNFSIPFPSPIPGSNLLGHDWKSPGPTSYRLMTAFAKIGDSEQPGIIQIALDVSSRQRVIANYTQKLAVVLALGVFLSSAVGVAVARKGLKPLEDLAGISRSITATQLGERIGPVQWPKELAIVASEFDNMLNRLQDSFYRLSQFSADLAHEIRTPINNIRGETEVALAKVRTTAEYQQVLESSLEECEKLSGIVDNLLFLARAENIQTAITGSSLDAGREVQAVQEFYQAWAAEQEVRITCEGASSLHADQVLVRRALSNLLSNSLQYTPRNGKILISVHPSDGQYVGISVSDTGCGIPSELFSRIFDRFYRTDDSRLRYPQGTGLGLAIVKSIMDLHGGKISVQSEPGKGTTVLLRFPIA